MSWTKRQAIEHASTRIGRAPYTFDMSADEYQDALNELDTMMATWNGNGIQLGYLMPSNQSQSDLDSDMGVPDWAIEAITTNLALRLGDSIGKQPSASLRLDARAAYRVVLNKVSKPAEMQYPQQLPRGAGNKTALNDRPFMNAPADPIEDGSNGPINF